MPTLQNVIRLDRYLSNFATKYKVEERVADFIAPPFTVPRVTDRFVQFTKNNLRVYDTQVAREEEAKNIDLDFTNGVYSCKTQELGVWIDQQDPFNMDANWNIDRVKTQLVLDAHRLAREYRVLQIATNPAIVTQTSTPSTKWDANGTPVADILNAMTVIKNNSTKTPNRITMTLQTALKLIQTDEWKNYFKFTTTGFPNLFNAVDGFKQLGLQPMISGTFGVNTAQGTASDPGIEPMLGKNVILWYGENSPTLESRTFMYSPYVKWNEAMMRYILPWKRGYKITALSVMDELLVDSQCAYLLTSVIA